MDFFDIIAIIGLIQALVVAVLIFTDDLFKNRANRHFAYFLILLSLVGLDARLSGYYEQLGSFWSLFFDIVGDDIKEQRPEASKLLIVPEQGSKEVVYRNDNFGSNIDCRTSGPWHILRYER